MRKAIYIGILLFILAPGLIAAEEFDATTASLEEILAAAEGAYQDGAEGRVEELIAAALERFPDEEGLAKFRVSWYMLQEDPAGALEVADGWLEGHAGDEQWMYLQSRLYRELGRDDDALATLDGIIALDGEGASRADVYFDKGDIYVSRPQPDYAGAAAAYEEGLIRIEPRERIEYPDVFYNLGCSYARLGDGEKALECLKAAFDAEPRFARDARDDEDLVSMQGNSDFEKAVARAEEKELELEAENTSIPLGDPAPDFALADIGGGKFSLSHFRGKPVVLNIWATWCPPCRREIPDLVDFAEDHRGEVVVLSISVDEPGTDLTGFAEEFKINYPVLLNADGAAESFMTVNQGIPQTYFIDEDGNVRGHILGSASRDVFESRLRRFVPAESE